MLDKRFIKVINEFGQEEIIPVESIQLQSPDGKTINYLSQSVNDPVINPGYQVREVDFAMPMNQGYSFQERIPYDPNNPPRDKFGRIIPEVVAPIQYKTGYYPNTYNPQTKKGVTKMERIDQELRTQTTQRDNYTKRMLDREFGTVSPSESEPIPVSSYIDANGQEQFIYDRPVRIAFYDNLGNAQIVEVTDTGKVSDFYPNLTTLDMGKTGLKPSDLTPEQLTELNEYARQEGAVNSNGSPIPQYTLNTLGNRNLIANIGDARIVSPDFKPFPSDARIVQYQVGDNPLLRYDELPSEIKAKIDLARKASSEKNDEFGNYILDQKTDGVDDINNPNPYVAFNVKGLTSDIINVIDDKDGSFKSGGWSANEIPYGGQGDASIVLPTSYNYGEDKYNSKTGQRTISVVRSMDEVLPENRYFTVDGVQKEPIPYTVGEIYAILNNDTSFNLLRNTVKEVAGDFLPEDLPDYLTQSYADEIFLNYKGVPFNKASEKTRESSLKYIGTALGQQIKANRQLREGKANPNLIQEFSESTLPTRGMMQNLTGLMWEIDQEQKVGQQQGEIADYLRGKKAYEAGEFDVTPDNIQANKGVNIGNFRNLDDLFRQELGESRPSTGIGNDGIFMHPDGYMVDVTTEIIPSTALVNGTEVPVVRYQQVPLAPTVYESDHWVKSQVQDVGNTPVFKLNPDGTSQAIDVGDKPTIIKTYNADGTVTEQVVNTKTDAVPRPQSLNNILSNFNTANNWLGSSPQNPLARSITPDFQNFVVDDSITSLEGLLPSEKFALDKAWGRVTDVPLPNNLSELVNPKAKAINAVNQFGNWLVSNSPLTEEGKKEIISELNIPKAKGESTQWFVNPETKQFVRDNPNYYQMSGRSLTDDEILKEGGSIDARNYRWTQNDPNAIIAWDGGYDPVEPAEQILRVEPVGEIVGGEYSNLFSNDQILQQLNELGNVYVLDSEVGAPMKLSAKGLGVKGKVPDFLTQLANGKQVDEDGIINWRNRVVHAALPKTLNTINSDELDYLDSTGYESMAQFQNDATVLSDPKKLAVSREDAASKGYSAFIPDRSYKYNHSLLRDASFTPINSVLADTDGKFNAEYLTSQVPVSIERIKQNDGSFKTVPIYENAEDGITQLDDILGRTYIGFGGQKFPLTTRPSYLGGGLEMSGKQGQVDPYTNSQLGDTLTSTIEGRISKAKQQIIGLQSQLRREQDFNPAQTNLPAYLSPNGQAALQRINFLNNEIDKAQKALRIVYDLQELGPNAVDVGVSRRMTNNTDNAINNLNQDIKVQRVSKEEMLELARRNLARKKAQEALLDSSTSVTPVTSIPDSTPVTIESVVPVTENIAVTDMDMDTPFDAIPVRSEHKSDLDSILPKNPIAVASKDNPTPWLTAEEVEILAREKGDVINEKMNFIDTNNGTMTVLDNLDSPVESTGQLEQLLTTMSNLKAEPEPSTWMPWDNLNDQDVTLSTEDSPVVTIDDAVHVSPVDSISLDDIESIEPEPTFSRSTTATIPIAEPSVTVTPSRTTSIPEQLPNVRPKWMLPAAIAGTGIASFAIGKTLSDMQRREDIKQEQQQQMRNWYGR